jgi:hypothetical protein
MPPHVKATEVVRVKPRRKPSPKLLREVYDNLKIGCSIPLAAWCSGVDPEDFDHWMKEDPTIYRRVMRETALFERELIVKAKAGGKTMCQSRASLELLSRISARYAQKTSVTVRRDIEALLDEFEKQLEPEAYMKVLNIIETHAK